MLASDETLKARELTRSHSTKAGEKASWKEHCGVFSVWNAEEAAHLCMLGLFALQHRGQEGAGIISAMNEGFSGHRASGLVSQVFSKEKLEALPGKHALGHVRYSTVGGSEEKNLQPLWFQAGWGELAIAHNGTLTNAKELRQELEAEGSVFQSFIDTEVLLHLFARSKGSFEERIQKTLSRVEGAFSLLLLFREKASVQMAAVKDPFGFRPLVFGKRGSSLYFSSESCAFDLVGADLERELDPGEIVIISGEGDIKVSKLSRKTERPAPCIFEWIYFSRPDSHVFDRSVYEFRKETGRILAEQDREEGFEADLVMGVPDSGIPAAIGYSQASGLPFEMGLVRNHYIGRTFIEPHQSIRDFRVKIKQNPLPASLKGKRVVVVDDSIVRGTTSKKINSLLLEAGAKEIHLRVAAPATVSPCYYGIDTPTEAELIAAKKTLKEIETFAEVKSLRYLNLEDLQKLRGPRKMCDACFSKDYPEAPPAV